MKYSHHLRPFHIFSFMFMRYVVALKEVFVIFGLYQ